MNYKFIKPRIAMRKLLAGILLAGVLLNGNYTDSGMTEIKAATTDQIYTVDGTVYTLICSNNDYIAANLNKVIKAASQAGRADGIVRTVVVPTGVYCIDEAIVMKGYVTLNVTGCELYLTVDTNMVRNNTSDTNKVAVGYGLTNTSGEDTSKERSNMKIIGGVWNGKEECESSLFRFCHATSVAFEGVTLVGGYSPHQMEVCAIDGFIVSGCVFKDMGRSSKDEDGNYEAIQIDVPVSSKVFSACYSDGTPMKNVVITGNVFENVSRGLGSHTMLIGAYHDNVTITNNTFTNVEKECVIAVNYTNCDISGNVMTNVGGGILVQTYKAENTAVYNTILDKSTPYQAEELHALNVSVANNSINISDGSCATEPVGIKIYGKNQTTTEAGVKDASGQSFPKGNHYITGVSVTGNVVTGKGHGIHLQDAYDIPVTGNTITTSGISYDGIVLDAGCANAIITGNNVAQAGRAGIAVRSASTVNDLSANAIANTGTYGILLYNGSKAPAGILNNTITNPKSYGIYYCSNVDTPEIKGNVITSGQSCGIKTSNTLTATTIKNNTIDSCTGDAISIGKAELAIELKGNTVKNCGAYPIKVEAEGIANISNTKVSDCEKENFYIVGNAKDIEKDAKEVKHAKAVESFKLAKADKGQIKVSWKKKKKITGYEIWYSTSKSFAADKTLVKTAKKSKTSITLKELKSKKKYFVKVRVYKKVNGSKVYGAFTSVKKIKTK